MGVTTTANPAYLCVQKTVDIQVSFNIKVFAMAQTMQRLMNMFHHSTYDNNH